MKSSTQFEAVVIGGGINGLTAACFLGRAKKRVLLLEKTDQFGGLASPTKFGSRFEAPGMLHDTSCIWPEVVDALNLQRFGCKLNAHTPEILIADPEGPGILLSQDIAKTTESIKRMNLKDADAYIQYKDLIKRLQPVITDLLQNPPPDVFELDLGGLWGLLKKAVEIRRLGKRDMLEFFRIMPMCVADWLNEQFDSQILKTGLAMPALVGTYFGPWSPLSNANLLFWECSQGTGVQGGASSLISALAEAAHSFNVTLRKEAEVKEICVEKGQVVGVELSNGEMVSTSTVFSTCDPKNTMLKLVTRNALPFRARSRIEHYRMRGTTAKVDLGVKSLPPLFDRASIVRVGSHFDVQERAFDPVKYGEIPSEPMLEFRALPGTSVISIQVSFIPHTWTDPHSVLKNVIHTMKAVIPDIDSRIEATQVTLPKDLESRFNLTHGHIHHGEHSIDQWLIRPTPECSHSTTPIAGLIMCGSGNYPGGGITCGPAALACREFLKKQS